MFSFVAYIAIIAAMLTHIVTCISEHTYLLLIAGVMAFPVGIIHGFGVWFGVF